MEQTPPAGKDKLEPNWQPIEAIDRRVFGVLIEKAKTTPNAYPLTLNALATGCNQKSNRSPVMNVDPADIEESIYRLRQVGAVAQVDSGGRVSKYRHYAYEWLGVDKVEIAVMAELLLRGPQTVGELRGRAARMEPIADVGALRPILNSLIEKGLVVSITPEGRGQVVSHTLFLPNEMERIRERFANYVPESSSVRPTTGDSAPRASRAAPSSSVSEYTTQIAQIQADSESLRAEVGEIRESIESLSESLEQMRQEFQRMKEDLGGM